MRRKYFFNYEKFEAWTRKNKITSVALSASLVLGTVFGLSDDSMRLFEIGKAIVGYEYVETVSPKGDGPMQKRLNLAKLEAVNYKIPSSSTAVVKFINLPMLNDSEGKIMHSHSHLVAVTPIKSTDNSRVFDGGDCRFGLEATRVNYKKMIAKFEILTLTCIDNEGIAYSNESDRHMGFISEIDKPGNDEVKIIDDDGYITVDPNKNYIAQMYEPITSIEKRGISFLGRF